MSFLKKLFKTHSEKEIKKMNHIVKKINDLETEISSLSDLELREKTNEFKDRYAKGETLESMLPEAFAVVRETSKRVLGMRHFDVQLIGGIVLFEGRIAEMKTGEGKTLVATLPAYLNAISGKAVHIVTVNEYLAKRDSEWMGKIFTFLGLSVGTNLNSMTSLQKKEAYQKDILYTTNNEIGFDYLRDNMTISKEDIVQRELSFAIIDEIDSILIDEARTPLIISGRATKSNDIYKDADRFVKTLSKKEIIEEKSGNLLDKVEERIDSISSDDDIEKYDYIVDLKAKSATLTSKGIAKAEKYFKLDNLHDLENSEIVHHLTQSLQANGVMRKDIDYIVQDGEALIVDEFTGRIMEGRRYSNGLHQAIEAKENIKIKDESQTLATITFQNYFRLYNKLAGMTGTAMTEKDEFEQIYGLDVIEIPTNKPVIRNDHHDVIYKTEKAKFLAVVKDVKESNQKGQPVLVGTASVETSENLSKLFKNEGIKHEVLNAKNHKREAEIVAQAGRFGSVTIATNMAGRGTDIMLGGNSEFLAKQEMRKEGYTEADILNATSYFETEDEEILANRELFKKLENKYEEKNREEKQKVIEAGGLKIIGTERHDSRRIDNQLRGRSGRQGDPGESIFYISLEDRLMKVFGGDAVKRVYETFDMPEDIPIQVGIISRAIENAQKRIEGVNFSARKYTLNYDDVMNVQRMLIYKQRNQVLDGENIHDKALLMVEQIIELLVMKYAQELEEGKYNKEILTLEFNDYLAVDISEYLVNEDGEKFEINPIELIEKVKEKVFTNIENQYKENPEDFQKIERVILLNVVDDNWIDHIDAMEDLKDGIGLRGYGQKDPVVQYRMEGAELFEEMNNQIKLTFTKLLTHIQKVDETNYQNKQKIQIEDAQLQEFRDMTKAEKDIPKPKTEKSQPIVNTEKKVGRNEPCPCGSGKKYKNCCGKNS